MQCEPRIPAQVRALARIRHRAEGELAVLEGHLDPGDPRRPVGSHGGDSLCLCRSKNSRTRRANSGSARSTSFHAVIPPNIAQAAEAEPARMSKTVRRTCPVHRARVPVQKSAHGRSGRSNERGEGAWACQLDLICAPQLMSARVGWPVQGGSVRLARMFSAWTSPDPPLRRRHKAGCARSAHG